MKITDENTQPVRLVSDPKLLEVIAGTLGNHPQLFNYVNTNIETPAAIITTKGLDLLINNLEQNSTLYLDTMSFLDCIVLLDITYNGGAGDDILILFLEAMTRNRREGPRNREYEEMLRENVDIEKKSLTNSEYGEELYNYLWRNKAVIGVYIYAQIASLYGLDTLKVRNNKGN